MIAEHYSVIETATYSYHRRDTAQYSGFLSEIKTSARRWRMVVSPKSKDFAKIWNLVISERI